MTKTVVLGGVMASAAGVLGVVGELLPPPQAPTHSPATTTHNGETRIIAIKLSSFVAEMQVTPGAVVSYKGMFQVRI